MEEAARFLLATLLDEGRGHLITGPSLSPENEYRTPDGKVARLCLRPTMDLEIRDAPFRRIEQASELLGIDDDFRDKAVSPRKTAVSSSILAGSKH